MIQGLGGDGEAQVMAGDPEGLVLGHHAEFAAFEHSAEVIAEHREQDFTAQAGVWGMPVDVEPAGERGPGSMAEDVGPGVVSGVVDPHVVGDNIQEQAQVILPKGANKFAEAGFAAQIGVDAVEIADVITVRALRPGGGDGGEIKVADAEIGDRKSVV